MNVDLRRLGQFSPVLSDISFQIPAQSIVGVFGESGCGKTTLARSLVKLLPAQWYRVRGAVRLSGQEVMALNERQLEAVRGAHIGFIFQDPLLALNPVMRVRDQVAEVVRAHNPQARERVEELFELAGLPAERRILQAYPHQLSGGERQRVTIAQALACRPPLVIADEAFTALDSAKVLELAALFQRLKETVGVSFLLIAHDPGVLARVADEVLIMRAGKIVEKGAPRDVLARFARPLQRRYEH